MIIRSPERYTIRIIPNRPITQQAVWEAATIYPHSSKLTFDLLTLNVVSESRVPWATSVPILIFLGLSILDLGPMYATDRQTSDAQHHLMPPPYGCGHNNCTNSYSAQIKHDVTINMAIHISPYLSSHLLVKKAIDPNMSLILSTC